MYFVAHIRPAAASCIKPLASCIYSLVNHWKATLRNDAGFATVYRRIYCRKLMTLSNQTSRYKSKRIRMLNCGFYSPSVLHNADIRCTNTHTWKASPNSYKWRCIIGVIFKIASSVFDRNASILNLLKFAVICWCAYYLTLSSKQILLVSCIRAFRDGRL